MKTETNITTFVSDEKFCILDGEEVVIMETDKQINKYAKKLKITNKALALIIDNHNRLIEALNEDLSQIWERLDKSEG